MRYCFFVLFILAGSRLGAQEADPAAVDTSAASYKFYKSGNFKCDSAAAHLAKKDEKGAAKFYEEAIKDYKKSLKMEPDYAAALKGYNAAVKAKAEPAMDPKFMNTHFALGKAQSRAKDYKNAIISFDMALTSDRNRADFFRERGIAFEGSGNDTMALKDYNRAIDKNYDDYEAYFLRAKLKAKMEGPRNALEDLTHAIESKVDYKDAYMQRGKIYLNNVKDYVLALNDFNKVIELDPENKEVYYFRGKTNFYGGAFKAAEKDLSRYLDMEPEHVDALITRGASRINTNNYSGAVRDFDDALKIEPKNVIALMNRGTAKGAMKNYTGALEDLDMAIKLKFDYSTAYVNRALVKYANHDKKGACKDLEKADGLNNEKAYDLLQQYCNDGRK